MSIHLLQLDLAGIAAMRHDPTRVDGIAVVEGGAPPSFILDGAIEAIRAGRPAIWYGPLLFVDPVAERIVGSGIFKGEPSGGWVEIGYGVAGRCQGQGHGTAAVVALVALAFARPGVHTVYAETSVRNIASQRVVRKAGFTWTGERRSDDDGPVDCWFVEAT